MRDDWCEKVDMYTWETKGKMVLVPLKVAYIKTKLKHSEKKMGNSRRRKL